MFVDRILSTQKILDALHAGREKARKIRAEKPDPEEFKAEFHGVARRTRQILDNFDPVLYVARAPKLNDRLLKMLMLEGFKAVSCLEEMEPHLPPCRSQDMIPAIAEGWRIKLLQATSVYFTRGESTVAAIPQINAIMGHRPHAINGRLPSR
jgi:hypothetical protein